MASICAIGGISASSWFFAAFLGIAKPLAGVLSLDGFLGLYALVLFFGVAGGLVFSLAVMGQHRHLAAA